MLLNSTPRILLFLTENGDTENFCYKWLAGRFSPSSQIKSTDTHKHALILRLTSRYLDALPAFLSYLIDRTCKKNETFININY